MRLGESSVGARSGEVRLGGREGGDAGRGCPAERGSSGRG